jgi:hypothetical protein
LGRLGLAFYEPASCVALRIRCGDQAADGVSEGQLVGLVLLALKSFQLATSWST